jgi:predicted metal-dependent TIM-barrel fold hydrolase
MSVEDQRRAVECGAVIEHCLMALTACCGPFLSAEAMVDQIRQVGPEHIVLSSDFGQAANGPPLAALTDYLNQMRSQGLTPQDIHTMMISNPAKLLIQSNDRKN